MQCLPRDFCHLATLSSYHIPPDKTASAVWRGAVRTGRMQNLIVPSNPAAHTEQSMNHLDEF